MLLDLVHPRKRFRIPCSTPILLSLWWLAYSVLILQVQNVRQDLLTKAAADTSSGNLYNQFIVLSFAALGCWHLPRAIVAYKERWWRSLVVAWLIYISWASSSILWSDDPSLTARRLAEFVCVTLGCFGLGTGYYGQIDDGLKRFGWHFLLSAFGAAVLIIGVGVFRGDFSAMMDPDWSLKNASRASYYLYYGGFATLASLFLFNRTAPRIVSFAFWIGFLVMLKGRTALISTLATACLISAPHFSNRAWRIVLVATGLIGVAFMIDIGTGGSMMRSVGGILRDSPMIDYLTLGHGMDDISGLNGRAQLWDYLRTILSSAPFQGHGFGAFWTPDRIGQVYGYVGWPAVDAHNGYLDELLATGIIGLLLTMAFWSLAILISLRKLLRNRAPFVFGWIFLLLLFNLTDSTFQFSFQIPTLVALIGLFALIGERGRNYSNRKIRTAAQATLSCKRRRLAFGMMTTIGHASKARTEC